MLISLYRPKTEFVICGDVNVDYLSDSFKKQQLLSHTVNFPSRFQNNFSSAIDNIFVSNSRLDFCKILPLYNGLSDHDAQCLILRNVFSKMKIISGKFKARLFTTNTIRCFQESLLKETWEGIYNKHDINEIFNSFIKTYINIFEASFPVITMINIKIILGSQKVSRYHVNGKEVCIFLAEIVRT
jgi:hypothetical protein